MKTRLKNQSEVIHFWANHKQPEGRAGSIFFENDRIFSYGRHFCMARGYVLDETAYLVSPEHCGTTRDKHKKFYCFFSRMRFDIPICSFSIRPLRSNPWIFRETDAFGIWSSFWMSVCVNGMFRSCKSCMICFCR